MYFMASILEEMFSEMAIKLQMQGICFKKRRQTVGISLLILFIAQKYSLLYDYKSAVIKVFERQMI